MSLDVYVYDEKMRVVSSAYIEIIETDQWGTNIDRQMNGILGGTKYGASMTLPSPSEPVIIWLDDTKGYFAPTSLKHLNGNVSGEVHVSLFPLPVGPGGGGDDDDSGGGDLVGMEEVSGYIKRSRGRGVWTKDEAVGVRNLVDVSLVAIDLFRGTEFEEVLRRWMFRLKQLGIDIMGLGGKGGNTEGEGWFLSGGR